MGKHTSSIYGTQYQESEAILAMQEGDTGHVDYILSQMLPNELRKLHGAAEELADRIHDHLRTD